MACSVAKYGQDLSRALNAAGRDSAPADIGPDEEEVLRLADLSRASARGHIPIGLCSTSTVGRGNRVVSDRKQTTKPEQGMKVLVRLKEKMKL